MALSIITFNHEINGGGIYWIIILLMIPA